MVSSLDDDGFLALCVSISIGDGPPARIKKEKERKVTLTLLHPPDIVKLSSPDRRGPKTILRGKFSRFYRKFIGRPMMPPPTPSSSPPRVRNMNMHAHARMPPHGGLRNGMATPDTAPRGWISTGCISTRCRNWMSPERSGLVSNRIGSGYGRWKSLHTGFPSYCYYLHPLPLL